MPQKTFITNMPDKAGAFLRASEIISEHDGNIVRVSYNKAVDLHMLFIDVEASAENLRVIEKALFAIGYMNNNLIEKHVIEVLIKIPDRPGAVLPVLRIFNKYEINISYINSVATDKEYQDFKMGLLIEHPAIIKTLLDEISRIYPINIIECDSSEENLDNTVFYIRLANEMKTLLNLSGSQVIKFVAESNRILQELQNGGEDAKKVFNYIRRFAYYINDYRGDKFKVDIETKKFSDTVTLYSIEPYCGSNCCVFKTAEDYVIIDTGYAIYTDEMQKVFQQLLPDWNEHPKRIYITHADVDHCGLLSRIANAKIIVNQKSAESLQRQAKGIPDFRENTPLRFGYSKISRIISGYIPPDEDKLNILDENTPENHQDLIKIGDISIGDLNFEVYEGSGGHLYGELVYSCPKAGVVFTGDILVNIQGFSKERAEFNSLAPYLMKSVNMDSQKANEMRKQVKILIENISAENERPCIVCGGHGPLSKLENGKLIEFDAL